MTSQVQRLNYERHAEEACGVRQMAWHYIGGERIVANGEQAANLPADATIVRISAIGGDVMYQINSATATAASPGAVAENQWQDVGPISNMTSLCVYGAGATVYAHVQYFREL